MKSALRGSTLFLLVVVGAVFAQADVNTTPSRATLDEASRASCDGVSVVVQRCAAQPDAADGKASTDPLTKSRAAAKAAFDRRDGRGRAAALNGETPAPTTAAGDAQRLGGVSVTGKADESLSLEQVLQQALNPNSEGTLSPDGKTISRYGLNGSRYDCVAKCVGPACCTEIRAMPNPARESNSIGR